jgi:hypothetical protein
VGCGPEVLHMPQTCQPHARGDADTLRQNDCEFTSKIQCEPHNEISPLFIFGSTKKSQKL